MKSANGWYFLVLGIISWGILVVSGIAIADTDADISARIRPIGTVHTEQLAPQPVAPVEQAAATSTPEVVAKAAPIAEVAPAPAATVADVPDGKNIYATTCQMCHAAGLANAPKLGDKVAWAPRIAKGEAALLSAAINGTAGGMPPRGACGPCSDADLKATVEYMVSESQ